MRSLFGQACRKAGAGVATALFLASCTGNIVGKDGAGSSSNTPGSGSGGGASPGSGGGVGPGPAGPGPGPAGPSGASGCTTVDPGPSPLRRLTRVEYDNTVRDLLGTQTRIAAELFPDDEQQFGFDNSAEGRGLNTALAEGYFAAADKLAGEAIAKLPEILACDPASKGENTCLDAFLDGFGQRAWRRPLEDGEKENLRQAFASGKGTKGTFADGINTVIQVMLMSPQFLYRDEQGVDEAGSDYKRLTSWELASRLSYLLWGSMPDEDLFTAARDGKLSTREQIAAQARRMLEDERAVAMMGNFYDQWLELRPIEFLDKDAEQFPAWKDTTAALMQTETRSLVQHVLSENPMFGELFTAPYTFVNQELAAFYGIQGVTGDNFRKVDLDPKQYAGIVTQGGFLASHATPAPGLTALIFRGVFVREHFLCEELPEPPENATDMNPPVDATTTPRSWSQARMGIAACGACHAVIDPIGYGFEGFDEIGLHKTGQVDTSGEVLGTDVSGKFNGPVELAQKLAGSKDAQSCLATQWFRFAHGRKEDRTRDKCSLDAVQEAFMQSGGDLRELLVALTQTDAFLLRSKGDR